MIEPDRSIERAGSHECCGCGVCVLVCPTDCISLRLDEDGYYKAIVDRDDCTECGLCQEVCYKYVSEWTEPWPSALRILTGYHRDLGIRYPSSSGGVGTAVAEGALGMGYKIIGAELDYEKMRLAHVVIDRPEDLARIRGSKYLPSYTVDALRTLKNGGKYLVIGTPCQIGCLRRAIPHLPEAEGIILVDFRCFGHPGYNLLDKYVDFLHTINRSGVRHVNMRDKNIDWKMWGVRVEFNDGTEYYQDKFTDPFAFCFRTGQAVHHVCLDCDIYKNQTWADIRLEDAWSFPPDPNDEGYKNGLSHVTLYTPKGQEFFDRLEARLQCTDVQIDMPTRHYNKFDNDGYLLGLLRQDKDLCTAISLLKKRWGPRKRFNWQWQRFLCRPRTQRFLCKPTTQWVLTRIPRRVRRSFRKLVGY